MKIALDELAERLADRLTEQQDIRDLEQFFFDHQHRYYLKDATEEQLRQDAINLGIINETDTLEIID